MTLPDQKVKKGFKLKDVSKNSRFYSKVEDSSEEDRKSQKGKFIELIP